MKIKLIITINVCLLITFLAGQSKGQSHKFIEYNKYWEVLFMDYPSICAISGGERCFFDRDTMINGLQYSIMAAHPFININAGPFCYPLAVNNLIKYDKSILREDTINKRVYKFDQNLNYDTLLFEFDLNVGDTLDNYSSYPPPRYVVDSVSSIQLLDGTFRNIYYTTGNSWLFEFIIEGIGGSRGPDFFLERSIDQENFVKCYSENGNPLWGDNINISGMMDCLGLVGVNDINSTSLLNVFPTLAVDELVIENLRNEKVSFSLFNNEGKLILKREINETRTHLDVKTLLPGVYLYKFNTFSSKVFSGKILVLRMYD